jgi:hypothetical protein
VPKPGVIAIVASTLAVTLAACKSTTAPGSITAPSGSSSTIAPLTTGPQTTADNVVRVAQLPDRFTFDQCDSPPVLAGSGHEVVALVDTSGNCPPAPPPLVLARIELPSGRVVLGPRVAGLANLFMGPTGQVFLINFSGAPIGHLELWRISKEGKPTPLLRLPFREETGVVGSYGDPAIAVAVVPNEDRAWVADGQHLALVNLGDGHLIATRAAPSDIEGNVTGLAMASARGPLYATFARRANIPLANGTITEINPATWSVISQRWYGGPVSYGRYGVVATPAGAWLSAGGGGNGLWMDLFSSAGLHRTHVTIALGSLFLLATEDVVWADLGGGGFISCFHVSASGSVVGTTVVGQMSPLLGAGSPFGESSPQSLLVASGVNLLAIPIPHSCASTGS